MADTPSGSAEPSPSHAQSSGRRCTSIDDFALLSRLGKGAISEVFKARDLTAGPTGATECAIKCISTKKLSSRLKHQVWMERDLLMKLKHPNVIKLYKAFKDKDHCYFVMELASQRDLGGLFAQYGRRFPPELGRFYAAEMVLMLEALRSQHVIHRDIKPENILISQDGHLRLCDFNLALCCARSGAAEGGRRHVATTDEWKEVVGSHPYLSPEVLRFDQEEREARARGEREVRAAGGGEDALAQRLTAALSALPTPYTFGVDLWSFGVILYRLLGGGQNPFADRCHERCKQMILRAQLPRFSDAFSPPARDLLSRLLVRDPAARLGFADLGAVRRHAFFENFVHDSRYLYEPHQLSSSFAEPAHHYAHRPLQGVASPTDPPHEQDGPTDRRSGGVAQRDAEE
eukprot:Selendium_serpulae@DN5438_c0_g1_i10.p1